MADALELFTPRNVGLALAAVLGTSVWLLRRYLVGNKCTNKVRLDGKTVVITGANSGIGEATALELARRGARIILACRNIKSAEETATKIRYEVPNADIVVKELDLASLASVRNFAKAIIEEEKRLDILVNNAGVWLPTEKRTVDGFEGHFGVNHLGHFLLTNLLLDLLKASAPSRIVVVSSSLGKFAKFDLDSFNEDNSDMPFPSGHGKFPSGYAKSKLANFLFTHELSKQLPQGVTVNALCPGMVWTALGRNTNLSWKTKLIFLPLGFVFLKRPIEGAQTVIYCATEPSLSGVSGKHFMNCEMKALPEHCTNDEYAKALWEASEKLTGLA